MHPIQIDKTCFRIDGEPVYLNAGEFHYFRVPRPDWERRMELFKEAGGNALATYIPWLIHEPEEGTFDFGADKGTTDLVGFLETARALDLYVIARPGPYQYSELIYGGLPGWLFERYPEVQAQTPEGKPFGLPSVSYLHPLFLEKVRAWFEAVVPILAARTVSRDGPIALTQFDNELMGIHIWFGGLDYNPATMGYGDHGGHYPRFLARRYGDIATLNAHYDAEYASFAEVPPLPPTQAPADPVQRADILRMRDTFDGYVAAATEYAQRLCAMLRELGIDTPLIHNAANPTMNTYFVELVAAMAEEEFLLGSDHYYNLGQSWPQNNPTPQYARKVLLSNEELRLMGFPPTILELPSGSASDWPPITASDAKACYMTNLAYGMKGHNYYVFTGGPNPPGVGETTDLYDYGAPIGAQGQVRPLYHAQAQVGAFIDAHPWLVESERVHDCRIGISFEDARSEQYWSRRGDVRVSPPEAWRFMQAGLLTTALCAALSPAFVNLDSDDWVADTTTPLLIAASARMPRDQQARLVTFLENGGRLLIAPILPYLDENLAPCTRLADALGSPELRPGTEAVIRVMVRDTEKEVANVLKNEVFFTDQPPEDAEVVAYDACTGGTLAWSLDTAGGGKALVVGLSWDHRKHEQTQALRALLNRLDLSPVIWCTNPNVWTTMRTQGNQGMLFLINLLSSPMETEVGYVTEDGARVNLGTQKIEAMSVKILEVAP
jgi:beta-galactosidase